MNTRNNMKDIKSEHTANLAMSVAPKIVAAKVGTHFAKPALKREIKTSSFFAKLLRK